MSQEVRSTTSVKGKRMSKKILKKQLKRSAKTTKILFSYEYEIKSRLTWEYADMFCDVSNWHNSLESEDFAKELIKIEQQMTSKKTVDPVESSMEITSTGDDQQSKSEGMVEDEPVGSAVNDIVMTGSPAPVYKLSVNVQNDTSLNLSATTDESSAAASDDICSEETFDKTTKKSTRFLKRASINNEITWQPVADDSSEIEATEGNIEVFNQVPEMLEHQELFHASADNNNTDRVKTHSDQKQHMKNPGQATDPKHSNQTKEKQFKCSECHYEFRYNSDLIVHMRTHSGEKPFQCTECPQVFSQKNNLTTHLRIHSGEKPFKCTECPKMFSVKISLTRHQRVHSGDKPFKCTECPKMFSVKISLTRHQRIHSGDKPFKCMHCVKKFSDRSNLTAHLRIHSGDKPFECTHCVKKFSDRSNLMAHLRIHSGDKPFECTHCVKKFSDRSNLMAHLRSHSGEKPFQCPHCLKAFTHSSAMKRHILTHSTE